MATYTVRWCDGAKYSQLQGFMGHEAWQKDAAKPEHAASISSFGLQVAFASYTAIH